MTDQCSFNLEPCRKLVSLTLKSRVKGEVRKKFERPPNAPPPISAKSPL